MKSCSLVLRVVFASICACCTASAAITGHWDFNNTANPFAANIGTPIEYVDPNSDTPAQTQGGTTTSFGIPNIAGTAAGVMKFGTNGLGRGYAVTHGAAANGDGFMVNKWSVIMDVLFPQSSSAKWRALLQTDIFQTPGDDAEFYIDEGNAVGISSYFGNVPANSWARLAFVADIGAAGGSVRIYINGTRVGQVGGSLDGRFALAPDAPFLLFTDGYETDVYTQPGYINSLQVHDEALTDAYIAALGAPTASGVPTEVQVAPFVRDVSPAGPNASPERTYSAVIENSVTSLNPASVKLTLNGQTVLPFVAAPDGNSVRISAAASGGSALLPPGSTNTWVLTFSDDSTPAVFVTNTTEFVVAQYQTIDLPAPFVFENFESAQEGSLPSGWTQVSFTAFTNPEEDFGNLDSATYARWTTVNADRFRGSFVTYSNPDNPADWESDYQRVLNYHPTYVLNGSVVKEFADGKFAFGNSGYRNDPSQFVELYTPDFNLTGRTNVHLAFNSIWEQNQDSIAGVEYSVDQGVNWKPVIYMIDASDILRLDDVVLGQATLNAEHSDVARYFDQDGNERGGTYSSFIKAPISDELSPFISGRIDDDSRSSKRIELFQLPEAHNKAAVRFRFFHAGTDSWYFGIDNFGLYSLTPSAAPSLLTTYADGLVTVTVQGGGTLQKTASLTNPNWQPVPLPVGANSVTEAASGAAGFYRALRP